MPIFGKIFNTVVDTENCSVMYLGCGNIISNTNIRNQSIYFIEQKFISTANTYVIRRYLIVNCEFNLAKQPKVEVRKIKTRNT